MKTIFTLVNSIIITALVSCQQFVEVAPPKTQIVGKTVYTSETTAESAMIGIYGQMMMSQDFVAGGSSGISALAGLSADELKGYADGDVASFNTNSLLPSTSTVKDDLWAKAYSIIYYTNAAIEGLANSSGIRDSVRNQLEGEAKFVRAFCYFYLTNLFGDLPIVTSSDYTQNVTKARSPTVAVDNLIVQDLTGAYNLLPATYPTIERTRPNKSVVAAFLARVYLYNSNWIQAAAQATTIINSRVYSMDDLNEVFLKNSPETIWQLEPVAPTLNTYDGNFFIIVSSAKQMTLTDTLVNSFEGGDQRKTSWIGSFSFSDATFYFPYKYKKREGSEVVEYAVVLRLAEQYLIRAEARVQINDLDGAKSDLNIVRVRAGLPPTSASDKISILLAIEQERKVEFFTEWGHRWLDLKRTSRSNIVLGPIKGVNWQSTDVLYPIPLSEINNDPNLSQNPGY